MACKYCHKKKEKINTFIQGNKYKHKNGDVYICARVTSDYYCLIDLESGNRYNDPSGITDVASPNESDFKEIK